MRERLENNDSRVALQPFILAERNRMLLRQMRRIRDEENELMKGVAGWETGTLYGEPVYHTTDPDEWTEPTLGELWTHASEKNIKERESWAFWV
ncbi:PREDICTED: NADH dehydrogenase [ubiquinone] 1 alpha subcomplex subunit 13-like [Priapulus caudatus]|uniref:NADH dehydrogenase [ubiquinone] 1 alpha subcomplex subunit 13 n=1 Tax=Priapulus caudatus TaxID=37621 RepID=A0ABM1E6N6_PRICU|nr:PREDICTED: NADH dehydrogenase [ubiquinone] 1 alpha subcomplex subunit 13-like [Priapulus caudatus]